MSIELLLVTAYLAVYRLTLLVSKEAGPFDMFGRFRTWAGVEYDQYSNAVPTGQLSEMILCPFCTSVWMGIGATILLVAARLLGVEIILFYALLPLALSGFSTFLFKWTGV